MESIVTPCARGYYNCLVLTQDVHPDTFKVLLEGVGGYQYQVYMLAAWNNNHDLLKVMTIRSAAGVPACVIENCTMETLQLLLDTKVCTIDHYIKLYLTSESKGLEQWMRQAIKTGVCKLVAPTDGAFSDNEATMYNHMKAALNRGAYINLSQANVRIILRNNDRELIEYLIARHPKSMVAVEVEKELPDIHMACVDLFIQYLFQRGIISAETLHKIGR